VRDWIRADGGGFLFLPMPPQFATLLSPLITVIVNIVIKELLSLEDNLQRRRFVICDEIAKLNVPPLNRIIWVSAFILWKGNTASFRSMWIDLPILSYTMEGKIQEKAKQSNFFIYISDV